MKFHDKYPDANYMDQFESDGDYVIRLSGPAHQHCYICEEFTNFLSISFETPVCSEECLKKLWDEYEATTTHDW